MKWDVKEEDINVGEKLREYWESGKKIQRWDRESEKIEREHWGKSDQNSIASHILKRNIGTSSSCFVIWYLF